MPRKSGYILPTMLDGTANGGHHYNNMMKKYLVSAAIVAVVLLLYSTGFLSSAYEHMAFAVDPTAARAYEYGDVHFRAFNPRTYDIDRAYYWYEKARELDHDFPGVYHQLARIAFLRGNFTRALNLINAEIKLPDGPVSPSSYYIRGLIEGYMGKYDVAAEDYATYLESDPYNWAAINDYAWVLLKAERYEKAAQVIEQGLALFPENAWLLNSHATALFELGRYSEALQQVRRAKERVALISERQWLTAYPGNDPQVAGEGIAVFVRAVEKNMHTIELEIATSTVQ
jgi:tetratricopeptide (TPR) repeat protein